MRFKCKYCKLVWHITEFRELVEVQSWDCFVTLRGIKHELQAILTPEVEE